MKNCYVYIGLFLLFGYLPVYGQEAQNIQGVEVDTVEYRFALGVQVGTDIGGAVPVPFKYIPETFNPYPRLNL